MTPGDLLVILVAASGIALVNWYFLFSRRTVAARAVASGGAQAATIRVLGGYTPDVIEVERGRPVRLTFDRQEDNPCSEEVVLPAFGIRKALPASAQTTVEFIPNEPGRFEFACGMGMLRGAIIVK